MLSLGSLYSAHEEFEEGALVRQCLETCAHLVVDAPCKPRRVGKGLDRSAAAEHNLNNVRIHKHMSLFLIFCVAWAHLLLRNSPLLP